VRERERRRKEGGERDAGMGERQRRKEKGKERKKERRKRRERKERKEGEKGDGRPCHRRRPEVAGGRRPKPHAPAILRGASLVQKEKLEFW